MAYYCLNVLHTAQYQKGIATLKRLEPLVKEAPLLRDIQIQIAQFEYLIGNTAKAELIWAQLDRETFDKADLSECVRSRLMLYLLSGDKSRGNALCRKYSVCDTALGDAIELYKIGSDPRNVSSPERAARSYRDYLNSLPPERILYLEPYAIRLECGLAELFAGNLEGAQKQLSDLGGRIYPYNGNCLLEYDIEAAKLFLALRKNDLHSFSRILDRLKETAGSVSPLLTGNLLKTLACCEQQTSSNALRKQIREVITSLNQTR